MPRLKEQSIDCSTIGSPTRKRKATAADPPEKRKRHELASTDKSKRRKVDEPAGKAAAGQRTPQRRQGRQPQPQSQPQKVLDKAGNAADVIDDDSSWNEDDPEKVEDDWGQDDEDAADGSESLDSSEDSEDEDSEDSEDDFDPEDCSTCEVCEGITLDSSTWKHAKRLQQEGWDICCCEEEPQQYGAHAEFSDAEDEDEDEDEDDEYAVDANTCRVWGRMFGGRSYDIVVGLPRGTPTRATGSVPKALPSDTVVADGVFGRQEKDGRHCLFGAPLGNAPKLLERIFNFRRPRRDVLLWQSELPLTSFEWRYITDALGALRLQPLLQHGQRVKDPLPENKVVPFPHRLRPTDCEGEPLKGPFVSTKTDKPWNRGRLFFSSFKSGVDSSFIWADGVKAMEPEAQQSFADEFGLF